MRWEVAKPNPSYLEYVALRHTWEAHQEQLKKTGPIAIRRFHDWLRNAPDVKGSQP